MNGLLKKKDKIKELRWNIILGYNISHYCYDFMDGNVFYLPRLLFIIFENSDKKGLLKLLKIQGIKYINILVHLQCMLQ